jgi:hypothetical protein
MSCSDDDGSFPNTWDRDLRLILLLGGGIAEVFDADIVDSHQRRFKSQSHLRQSQEMNSGEMPELTAVPHCSGRPRKYHGTDVLQWIKGTGDDNVSHGFLAHSSDCYRTEFPITTKHPAADACKTRIGNPSLTMG